MDWKNIVVKFYALKKHSLTFKGNLYDYAYISDKKSVGTITEILGENIMTIAFFPSMGNDKSFVDVINFNREKDFIIPRYESLLKFANYIIQKEISLGKTVNIRDQKFSGNGLEHYILHEKLAELYKRHGHRHSEYDMLLFFICEWLGIREIYEKY